MHIVEEGVPIYDTMYAERPKKVKKRKRSPKKLDRLDYTNIAPKSEPSIETGVGCFELHYDFSSLKNFNMSSIVGAYFKKESLDTAVRAACDTYPVITEVK